MILKRIINYNDSISEHIDKFGIIGSRASGCKNSDKWQHHKPAKAIKGDLGEKIFDEYLKFCVIRNPYDKMVSRYYWAAAYHGLERSRLSFKKFVKDHTNNNLYYHSIDGKSVCDYFIRYEYLEEDINTLCKKIKNRFIRFIIITKT